MKIYYSLLLLLSATAFAQLNIINNETPFQIVSGAFANPNIVLSSLKFNGTTENTIVIKDQISRFSTTSQPVFGMTNGFILANGKTTTAQGPNNSAGSSIQPTIAYNSDPDIATLATVPTYYHSVLEFDFIPTGSVASLQYVLASEEYPEWSNSTFNDVFGIFISGPGISGPFTNEGVNIATLPENDEPVSINNINNGTFNGGPCENCQFYISNGTGSTPLINTLTQFDGYTTIMTAIANVQPGQLYHIKVGIGQTQDIFYDSAVILKANSFTSTSLAVSNQIKNNIKVYPNPTYNFVKIDSPQTIHTITITDLTGKILKQKSVNAFLTEINISDISAGHYIIEILGEEIHLVQRLIKH